MTITLHNTATRKKEVFEPLDRTNVRMYVCGPTVYDRAHLGNARPVVVFDILNRLLRHTYGEGAVTYVRNFTDVDDKINATAVARKEAGAEGSLEDLVRERSNETIDWYHADMDALGALRPDKSPRATDYIAQMIALIEDLIAKDFAYVKEGHALFRVRAYKDYGKLSGRSVDDMIAGARVEVAPFKEDPMDFVLWKPSDDELPGWDSPWGRGRPGWHIECSAMAADLLGESFDIHGGGNDLQFPHHENEIAQSKCAGHDFARYWLHNEMLQVEGKKMSKSLGNFFTVRDLLDQGVPGEVIRFVMLSTHYRKPMDWTEKKRAEAEKRLSKMAEILSDPFLNATRSRIGGIVAKPPEEIVEAVASDLNTSLALSLLNKYLKGAEVNMLSSALIFLGFDPDELVRKFHSVEFKSGSSQFSDGTIIESRSVRSWGAESAKQSDVLQELGIRLQTLREEAKETKDFSALDMLKSALVDAGIEVRMTKTGVDLDPRPDFDPSKLEGLL